MDHLVHDEGNVPLALLLGAALGEPGGEAGLECVEKGGRETPEVHGDALRAGELHGGGGILLVLRALGRAHELRHLRDAGEFSLGRHLADAARDGAVVGEREVELVADHRELEWTRGGVDAGEEGRETREGVAAIEVVRVDCGEWLAHHVARGADRVGGTPRFRASSGDGVGGGEVVDVLEGVVDGQESLVLRAHLAAEHLLDVLADDEHDLAETGAVRVEHGIVENGLSRRAHGIYLLEAAITGSHSCGQNYECWFHLRSFPVADISIAKIRRLRRRFSLLAVWILSFQRGGHLI